MQNRRWELLQLLPLSGLFVLPSEASAPPGSNAVGDGFFVKVWSYPLDKFEVKIRDEASTEGAIFSWNQYAVYARNGCEHLAIGTRNGDRRRIDEPVDHDDLHCCGRNDPHRNERAIRYGSLTKVFHHCPAG